MFRKAKEEKLKKAANSRTEGMIGDLAKTMGRTISRQVGNEISRKLVRGLLGTLLTGAVGVMTKKRK